MDKGRRLIQVGVTAGGRLCDEVITDFQVDVADVDRDRRRRNRIVNGFLE